MDVLANNLEQLIAPVKKCRETLKLLKVAAGAFHHAYEIRDKTSGAGGLKEDYLKILDDLEDGLTSLCSGVRDMSKHYSLTEEANDMTAEELNQFMQGALKDFGAMSSHSTQLGGD
jgi:hypothetical protein